MVPFTVRNLETVEGAPPDAEWHDVSGDSHNYWRLLCGLWERSVGTGDDLLIVEHDVVCRPDVVEQFESCDCDWGVFGYQPICHEACQEAWANMLGCTRFTGRLIRACPDAVSGIPGPVRKGAADDLRDWHNLCDSIAGDKVGGMPTPLRPGSLRYAGFSHHWHAPAVHHVSWDRYGVRAVGKENG